MSMVRILAALAMFASLTVAASAEQGEKANHRLIVHVDENDVAKLNFALNNVVNVTQYYSKKGEEVEIEVVAYGPGLHMLRADTSAVKERIISIGKSMPHVEFAACETTMTGMKKAEKKDTIELLPKVKVVPAGVTRIMELQEQGWSYVRP
jgi:intracellular sulfur oxidation DsrE/DsrF family protein